MTSRLAGYGHRAPRIARRRAIVFSVLVGISMILMIASATAPVAEVQRGLAFALSPFAEGVNGVGREVRSVIDAAAEIDRLRRENATLRSDNDRLEQRNRTLAALAAENEELTALLAIRNTLDYSTVAARVISRELADVSRVVMIDKRLPFVNSFSTVISEAPAGIADLPVVHHHDAQRGADDAVLAGHRGTGGHVRHGRGQSQAGPRRGARVQRPDVGGGYADCRADVQRVVHRGAGGLRGRLGRVCRHVRHPSALVRSGAPGTIAGQP